MLTTLQPLEPDPAATIVACHTLPLDFSENIMPPLITILVAFLFTNTQSSSRGNFLNAFPAVTHAAAARTLLSHHPHKSDPTY
jgi:hypothetical protein